MDASLKTLEPSSTTVTLPIELIFTCILPKLPIKSVLRFKCVSKSFLTEISSPKFNALFTEANPRLLIIPGDCKNFRIYELESLHSPPTLCPYPIPSKRFAAENRSIVACCESYLLIGFGYTNLEDLILFNLATRIYRVIPTVFVPRDSMYVHYAMCHCLDDEFNDDIKIVRFVNYGEGEDNLDMVKEVIVYSLNSDSWKRIERKPISPSFQRIDEPILVQNHLLVMILYDGFGYDCLTTIGCFDVKAERWSSDVLLPDVLLGEIGSNLTQEYHSNHLCHLGLLEGQLSFSFYDVKKSTYSAWVMKDYGVKESWVKLMSVPVQDPGDVYHPIAYCKGLSRELLCRPKYRNKYKWYNIREKQFTETGFDGEGLDSSYYSFAYICKGSLLNFPGGQPINSSSKKQDVDVDVDVVDDDDDYAYAYGYDDRRFLDLSNAFKDDLFYKDDDDDDDYGYGYGYDDDDGYGYDDDNCYG